MEEIRKSYHTLSPTVKRVFWGVIVLALAMSFFSTFTFPDLLASTDLRGFTINSIPMFISLFSFMSAGLILSGRGNLGSIGLYIALLISLFLTQLLAEGFAYVSAVVLVMVGFFIPGQVLPERSGNIAVISSFIGAALIILLDAFYVGDRFGVDIEAVLAANVITLVLVVLLITYIGLQFKDYPLWSKLILAFLLAAALPVIIVSAVLNLTTQDTYSQVSNQQLTSTAAQLEKVLDTFLLTNLNELRVQAQFEIFQELIETPRKDSLEYETVAKQSRQILAILAKKDPIYIVSYGILNRQGLNLLDTDEFLIGGNELDTDYFQNALRKQVPVISSLKITPDGQKGYLFFATPLRNAVGEIIGVLRIKYDAGILQQIVFQNSMSLQGPSTILLADDANIVLAHSKDPELLLYKTFNEPDSESLPKLQEQGRLPDQPVSELFVNLAGLSQGIQKLDETKIFQAGVNLRDEATETASGARLEIMPWTVVVAQPTNLLNAPIKDQYRTIVVLAILTAAGAAGLSLLITQLLATPVTRLTRVAQEISAGNLDAQAKVETGDEIGVLAGVFNNMTAQLRDSLRSLEKQVAERTQAIVISSEVSRRLSTILDQQQLLLAVVNEIQQAFNFYHAQIYLYDEQNQNLVMVGGTGDVGKILMERGHKIPYGKGLVGRAAEANQTVLVSNTEIDPNWLPNELLADTKSEAAVPIAIGDRVLGVLDVQHNITNGIDEQGVNILQSIANQVAIAVENARLFSRVQKQAEREALILAVSQKIQAAGTIEAVIETAVREIGQALRVQKATIQLNAPDRPGTEQ